MQYFKSNFYNVLVPVEEEQQWLLYNTLSGGLEVLSDGEGGLLSDIINGGRQLTEDEVNDNPFLSYLHQHEYITDISEPERQNFIDNYRNGKKRLHDKEVSSICLTIGTTITCNMGCPYCFEFEKPNKSLRSDDNIEAIVAYLEDIVAKAPVKKWQSLLIVWYGGEPLINAGAIEKLSPRFFAFCEKYGMDYSANIITNGLLLTEKTWTLLKENRVDHLQITIDGPEETHNKKRPLKNMKGENYKKILSNIALAPEGMDITIRVNVDKEIARRWDEFFNDFYNFGIWPQHFRSVHFAPSWLRPYAEITDNVASDYLTNEQFFDELQSFRIKQLGLYNAWATDNGQPQARLQWTLPALQEDCGTWVSPYNIVIDPQGYVQKCWETIHDASNHIHHVSEGFKPELFSKFEAYDKIALNNICSNCQILPVCDKLPCAFDAIKEGKPVCSYWKAKLPESLKTQYLMMRRQPELMAAPFSTEKVNDGHTNK